MIPRHEQEMIWASKPMLRRVYNNWYKSIKKNMGIGFYCNPQFVQMEVGAEIDKDVACVAVTNQEDVDVETANLRGVDALFGIDVLHHITSPKNAMRNLVRMGGGSRVIWLEPDCASVLGWLVYSLHFEGLKHQRLASDWFLGRKFSMEEWRVVRVDRWCDLLHLVSGGWTGRQLLPDCASGLVEWVGGVLSWFPSLFSTRMMVVLERR